MEYVWIDNVDKSNNNMSITFDNDFINPNSLLEIKLIAMKYSEFINKLNANIECRRQLLLIYFIVAFA